MNVILVNADTFRRDNLSCYGGGKVKTPRLDRFAETSYVFDNFYLGSFPTAPNRLDIMSGRFSFIDHEWCPLPSDTVTWISSIPTSRGTPRRATWICTKIGKSLMPERDGGTFSYEAIRMYDEIRHIPLIIHLPGETQGRHLKAMAQAPDLMPTILEMAGLVATESVKGHAKIQALQCGMFVTEEWRFEPEMLHGKSLMPLLRGETDRLRDAAVCSNTLIHHTPILAKSAVITEDGWCLHYAGQYPQVRPGGKMYTNKLIDVEGAQIATTPALYRLTDDPKESRNLIDQNAGLAREIHRRYVTWLEEIGTPEEHLAGRRTLL